MARAAVRWSLREVARGAGLSLATVARIEVEGRGATSAEARKVVQRTFEANGITFVRRNAVRLLPKPEEKVEAARGKIKALAAEFTKAASEDEPCPSRR